MKRLTLTIAIFILFFQAGSSQSYKIKGAISDTLENELVYATVLLLEPDSTMIEYTRTEIDGSFVFKNVSSGEYIVQSTYVGYIPKNVNVTVKDEDLDMGRYSMIELNAKLMEVVIKAAKAPIRLRGDTIEYDASQFVVPEGSSLEELLIQLPGMELDADGTLKSEGKDITKVTVDGKEFFGGDTKMATKNLPAEGIKKVQVFDKKSEEEELTGIKKEAQEKTMNVELKDEFKSGGFGSITAGYGTNDRYATKGNFNRFNEKIQFSLIGSATNSYRDGLSFNDYREFRGSNSFRFSSGSQYGFGGNRGMLFFTTNNDFNLESGIQNVFFSGSRNTGYPESILGGINFNYSNKKSEFSTVYFYNENTQLNKFSTSGQRNFPDYTYTNQYSNNSSAAAHKTEITYRYKIDSLHTLRLEVKGGLGSQINTRSEKSFAQSVTRSNETVRNNGVKNDGRLLNSILYFRKKFKKKARSFGANVAYLTSRFDKADNIKSDVSFKFMDRDSVASIDQYNISDLAKDEFKSNAIYVEPLSKTWFLQTFANYSKKHETGIRTVNDRMDGSFLLNRNLSRDLSNDITYRRLGSSIRYSSKGYNVSTGLAYKSIQLQGRYKSLDQTIDGSVDKTFGAWIPYFSLSGQPVRNSWLDFSYILNVDEPPLSKLQPIVDNRNPLFIREGNPNLEPTRSHSVSWYMSRSIPVKDIRLSTYGSYDYFTRNIIQDEVVGANLATRMTYLNYKDSYRGSVGANFSFPIIENILKSSIGFNGGLTRSYAYVTFAGLDRKLNRTNGINYGSALSFTFTPIKKCILNIGGRWKWRDTKYSINTSQDQSNIRQNYSASIKTPLFAGLYLNANYTYTIEQSERFNINQQFPLLNASLYYQFLKGKRAEIRLSAFDLLDQYQPFSYSVNNEGYSSRLTESLERYFMFSFTYNIRGLKNDASSKW